MTNTLDSKTENTPKSFAYSAMVATIYSTTSILNWPQPGEFELYDIYRPRKSFVCTWGERVGMMIPFVVALAYRFG